MLTKVIVVDNKLSPGDIRKVIEAKKKIIEKDGVLEYYPVEESMDSIAGLENLKMQRSSGLNSQEEYWY